MTIKKALYCTCDSETESGQVLSPRDLIVAAAKGHLELIQKYLSHGGHPDATITGKPTALCYAAMSDDMEMAWLLIKAGALLDYQDGAGNDACIYAVLTGSGDVFELLLASGADLNVRNRQGKSPMDYVHCTFKNNNLIRQVINDYQRSHLALDQQTLPMVFH